MSDINKVIELIATKYGLDIEQIEFDNSTKPNVTLYRKIRHLKVLTISFERGGDDDDKYMMLPSSSCYEYGQIDELIDMLKIAKDITMMMNMGLILQNVLEVVE